MLSVMTSDQATAPKIPHMVNENRSCVKIYLNRDPEDFHFVFFFKPAMLMQIRQEC